MDRFIAIKCPVRYKTLVTRTQIKGIILAIWLFSTIGTVVFPHSLPKVEYEDFLEYYDTFHLCMSDTHDHKFENTSKIFAALLIILYFIIPFVLIFGICSYVIKASRDQQNKLNKER